MKLLFASQNKGKQTEISHLFQNDSFFKIIFPQDLVGFADFDVEEDGKTFSENALKKAQQFAENTHVLSFADDSGLCVAVLGGFPGVISNRWHPGSAQEKNQALLDKISDQENRQATFITVMAAFDPATQKTFIAEARLEGTISQYQQGSDGFGYDPIFIPNGYTKTLAELGVDIKNTLSAREKAATKLQIILKKNYS